MLTRISNTPRAYAWGSTTLLAELQGRTPSGEPEAEIWFGDHPGSPALVHDGSGRTLDAWINDDLDAERLPYLLKLLAAGAPLSIQAHPSKAQAEEGFAREEAAGVPRDAGHRNYRDDNHKPELIVAVSDRFQALAGLRDLAATRRLIAQLGTGEGVTALASRLDQGEPAEALRNTIGWLLSGEATEAVRQVIAAAAAAAGEAEREASEFGTELALAGRLAEAYPDDPGVVVALLMNLVSLERGDAVFVPAGVLHAYVEGLGVELMAASDNVLRGGLTPKHIDVEELLGLLDPTPSPPPVLRPVPLGEGAEVFDAGVPDFVLAHVPAAQETSVPLTGIAIALAVGGTVEVTAAGGASVALQPGEAAVATADESPLILRGGGEAFVAMPGSER